MSRLRSRRALLASIATSIAVTTGGFEYGASDPSGRLLESGTVPADWYECRDVARPEPDSPDDADALEPLEYPAPPSQSCFEGQRPPSNRSSATRSDGDPDRSDCSPASGQISGASQYVIAFERAYQRNAFIERYRSAARTVELRRIDYRTAAIGSSPNADAVLVALRYDLTTGTRQSSRDSRVQWDIRTTYYVDDRSAFRARYSGVAEELTFVPDPRTRGELVACFG
ncbi:hypothetical protein [Natrinema ejinorense]|uniref:Uncharacterized protein n=1 Tax=Natrinema ejinorense TaxID=373386 RepID=A0A2A5QY48_9EURY|nr:hypothetical protein [Natrinema ejinorense]PCR91760.1 hypothetical protein CP557_15250 [Natrinema ejinorense]